MYNLVWTVLVKRCRDPELTDKFSWSVKSQFKKNYLLGCVLVHWEKPFEDVSENKSNLSTVIISLDHQEKHPELKSTITTDKNG